MAFMPSSTPCFRCCTRILADALDWSHGLPTVRWDYGSAGRRLRGQDGTIRCAEATFHKSKTT